MDRVLVIGLDGGCFDQLAPLMERGIMPRLRDLAGGGARGPLTSVVPPITAPAWVSFMTGARPCRHGVFDFLRSDGGGRRRAVNARDIAVPTLWQTLAAHGARVGCFNVPVTYPPLAVDGFMWSGLLTPPDAGDRRCEPPRLVADLEARFGRFIPDVSLQSYLPREAPRLIRDAIDCLDRKGDYTAHLMGSTPWDFFMTVITETDRIQHVFSPELAAGAGNGHGADPEVRTLLERFYRRVDDQVGRLCDLAGPETRVFIISDHGFGPLDRLFFANQWLQQQGFLTVRDPRRLRFQTRLLRLRINPFVRSAIRRLDVLRLRSHLLRRMKGTLNPTVGFSNLFQDTVDWSRTRAYVDTGTQQGIYINLRGRQQHGIVEPGADYERTRDEIIARLKACPDPRSGGLLAVEVRKREEVYDGPLAGEAPDILFSVDGMRTMAVPPIRPEPGLFLDPIWPILAHHRPDGMLVAAGPGLASGPVRGARLIDVMPTLLHALGLPIPAGLDGVLLEKVFTPEFLASRPPRHATAADPAGRRAADDVLTEEESLKVEQSLRDLGYIE
jgi:predicted AlkP superfamily phosphohydrolase/phosphomutase